MVAVALLVGREYGLYRRFKVGVFIGAVQTLQVVEVGGTGKTGCPQEIAQAVF